MPSHICYEPYNINLHCVVFSICEKKIYKKAHNCSIYIYMSLVVLIDAENMSDTNSVMSFLSSQHLTRGVIRAYGDFSNPSHAPWLQIKNIQHKFTPPGKNATDAYLMMDAVRLLHNTDVKRFVILSDDKIFKHCKLYLRKECGMEHVTIVTREGIERQKKKNYEQIIFQCIMDILFRHQYTVECGLLKNLLLNEASSDNRMLHNVRTNCGFKKWKKLIEQWSDLKLCHNNGGLHVKCSFDIFD